MHCYYFKLNLDVSCVLFLFSAMPSMIIYDPHCTSIYFNLHFILQITNSLCMFYYLMVYNSLTVGLFWFYFRILIKWKGKKNLDFFWKKYMEFFLKKKNCFFFGQKKLLRRFQTDAKISEIAYKIATNSGGCKPTQTLTEPSLMT
jgi:hypothetical protein